MNESNRAEVFAALAELAGRYPHWRIGQLVTNATGWADAEIWDVEDEQLLTVVRAHLEKSRDRIQPSPVSSSTASVQLLSASSPS